MSPNSTISISISRSLSDWKLLQPLFPSCVLLHFTWSHLMPLSLIYVSYTCGPFWISWRWTENHIVLGLTFLHLFSHKFLPCCVLMTLIQDQLPPEWRKHGNSSIPWQTWTVRGQIANIFHSANITSSSSPPSPSSLTEEQKLFTNHWNEIELPRFP